MAHSPEPSNVEASEHRAWVLDLLDRYETRLTRYASRITGDVNSARDVVQQVFVTLCSERRQDVRQPAAWLYTVCYRRALDSRRQVRRTISCGSFAEAYDEREADYEPSAYSREPAPGELSELKDTSAALRRIVGDLPENQRQVILLWCEGFRYREISEITGHGEGYVRVLAQRALCDIRNHPRCAALRDELTSNQ